MHLALAIDVGIPIELADFEDIILEGGIIGRLLPKGVEHTINLKPRTRPLSRLLYNLSKKEIVFL